MGLPNKRHAGIKAVELKEEAQKKVSAEIGSMSAGKSFLPKLREASRSSRLGKKFLDK